MLVWLLALLLLSIVAYVFYRYKISADKQPKDEHKHHYTFKI